MGGFARPISLLIGKVCLKEGCGEPLIGQQKKRRKEHHWQCAKEGCTKNEQSNYGGFCKVQFSSNLILESKIMYYQRQLWQ